MCQFCHCCWGFSAAAETKNTLSMILFWFIPVITVWKVIPCILSPCERKRTTGFSPQAVVWGVISEDAQGFLQIIREDGEIERLFKYRNPIRIFHISDAPARSFGMTFSDGNSVEKETRLGDRALDYLYALADRHYKSAESVEVTAVSIHRNCMDYSSSCSFCLEKNEGVWLFSFDAEIDRSGGHTEAENQRIEEDAAEEILRIVKERQLVTRVKQYEMPPDDDIFALDETTYWTSFEFADGSSIDAPIDAGAELIDAFYSLAKIKIHQR